MHKLGARPKVLGDGTPQRSEEAESRWGVGLAHKLNYNIKFMLLKIRSLSCSGVFEMLKIPPELLMTAHTYMYNMVV